jgi:hypothetical protein
MKGISGIIFEKDASGNDRYIRIDLHKHKQLILPFMLQLGLIQEYPQEWDDALTSEEFLLEAKKMIKEKLDVRNKIS